MSEGLEEAEMRHRITLRTAARPERDHLSAVKPKYWADCALFSASLGLEYQPDTLRLAKRIYPRY